MSQATSSSNGLVPVQQNFYATIVDIDPQQSVCMDTPPVTCSFTSGSFTSGSMAIDSTKSHRPPRPPRAKRPKPDPTTTGPTNKQQFDAIAKYLNHLNERLSALEKENNNLKAMITLSGIKPVWGSQQIDHVALGQMYQDRLSEFTQCMR